MIWTVTFTNSAAKQLAKLSENVRLVAQLLTEDLKYKGPAPGKEWPNYSKLNGRKNKDRRHCHLMKGRPTYVACWEVSDHNEKLIEVYYVGTHEKAPY